MQKTPDSDPDKSCQICVQHACFLYKITRQENDDSYDPETKKQKEQNDWFCDALDGLKSQTIEK